MRITLGSLVLLGLLGADAAHAIPRRGEAVPHSVQAGFVETVIADSLDSPISMAFAPDGRIFICEQDGALRVIKNGEMLSRPFVVVPVHIFDEQGLLSVAFHPQFASNGWVYVMYTAATPTRHNRIVRYTASGDTALAGSALTLIDLPNNVANYHMGGALHFGPDGRLYASTGDNGNGANAQSMTTTFGKMLRLGDDGTIPTDNPFYGTTTGIQRAIWARGLRNPFTFAFQPGTGRLFINDVGADAFEEIDEGFAGHNYGWPNREGPGGAPTYTDPIHWYGRSQGCAITGGTFYNPPASSFPAVWMGRYFYAEYCENEIRWIDPANPLGFTVFGPTITAGPVDLRVAPDGDLYYISRGNSASGGGVGSALGIIVRISYAAGDAPTFAQQPLSRTVGRTQTATFSVAANGQAPLSYQWQRNASPIAGATAASYTTPPTTLLDNGAQFRCVVTNVLGSLASDPATLTVLDDLPPTVTLVTPVAGEQYRAGTLLEFSATAEDPETGALPASAFTWSVVFHHSTHTHPAMPDASGIMSGSYPISQDNHTETDVWYRVAVRVQDPAGVVTTAFRDVLPDTVRITLATEPPGLELTLDAQPMTAPLTFTSIKGLIRSIGAPSPQTLASQDWRFVSWSTGAAAEHEIESPLQNATYTATFELVPSDTTVSTDGPALAPGVLLAQPSPNPARDRVAFAFMAPRAGDAQLEVYDLAGHRLATLASGHHAAGAHRVTWNASGTRPGVYLARLRVGAREETRRLVVVR